MSNEPETKTPDLACLYREYHWLVQMQHYRFTGDRQTAEDLTQDTFEKLAKHIHRYDGRASFKTWLTYISRNIAMDYLRRRKVERRTFTLPAEFAEDSLAPYGCNPITPEDEAISRETESRLNSFFAAHPHQKSVETLLLNLSGHSEKDISELLNLGSMAIKLRRHRIRRQMKQYFQDGLRH